MAAGSAREAPFESWALIGASVVTLLIATFLWSLYANEVYTACVLGPEYCKIFRSQPSDALWLFLPVGIAVMGVVAAAMAVWKKGAPRWIPIVLLVGNIGVSPVGSYNMERVAETTHLVLLPRD